MPLSTIDPFITFLQYKFYPKMSIPADAGQLKS